MIFTIPTTHSHFSLTTIGSSRPDWLLESFFLEADVRQRWWYPKKNDVVFDVGAGYGSYALPAAAEGATVYAFEPDRNGFFDLYTNVVLNNFEQGVALFNLLVGNPQSTGYVTSHYDPETHSCRWKEDSERRFVVKIDELVLRLGLERFDWLKIDTEGVELQVLEGAVKTLNKFKPKVLLENHVGFVPDACEQTAAFFRGLSENWQEQRLIRPTLGENANWSFWEYKA